MQIGENEQNKVEGDKQATEQVQGREGRKKEQPKNNYIQARANPLNPTNR